MRSMPIFTRRAVQATPEPPKPPNPFKQGDKVQHKTGGPEMLVVNVAWHNKVTCEWFNANHELQTHTFNVADVVKVADGAAPKLRKRVKKSP